MDGDAESITFDDERDDVKIRARKAGIRYEVRRLPDDRSALRLYLPNGRKERAISVSADRAGILLKSDFESWIFLGDHIAIYNTGTNCIEAQIRYLARRADSIYDLQWVTYEADPNADDVAGREEDLFGLTGPLPDEKYGRAIRRERRAWKLDLESNVEGVSAMFSPCSPALYEFARIPRRDRLYSTSLTINGKVFGNHDQALGYLQRAAASLSFEFDLRYGLCFGLEEVRRLRPIGSNADRIDSNESPPRMPRVRYSPEAVSLYQYARSSRDIPLLEFLAYYQAIEYYVPAFYRQDVLSRIRRELRDPRFDVDNDKMLTKLLQITSSTQSRGVAQEREQLRSTVRQCIEEDGVKEFIETDERRLDAVTSKTLIRNVHPISFRNRDFKIVDQVSERIYDIRCRIVHSKEDGGPRAAEVLLPFSAEAKNLTHDIDLVRYVAQKVIIAGSSGPL